MFATLRRFALGLCIALSPLPAAAACQGRDLLATLPGPERAALEAAVAAQPFAVGNHWRATRGGSTIHVIGTFHMFDVDSGMEDSATGFVAATMIYVKPETAKAGVDTSRHLWAFDCTGDSVFYVATSTKKEGRKVTADWRAKPSSLAEPVMGGVTNMFGKKLCALKGSWPRGDLPTK